jgi:hypothetical protein
MEDAIHLKKSRLKLRYLLLALILLAAAAGAGTGTYLWLRGGEESIRVIIAVQIPYPAGWSEEPLTEADRDAGLLLKLERERPEASFLARTVIATLATDFDINELADDTEAALSAEIENFQLVRKSVSPIGPFDAVRISYRQEGEGTFAPDYQVLMAIVPTPNQTFYLTLRAEKKDFRKIEDEGLYIIDAFASDVSANLQ